jgi:hypothetical protein
MKPTALLAFCLAALSLAAEARVNFEKATISYIQNDVAVADIKLLSLDGNAVKKTNASLNQPITKENAVVTGDKSRAELKFNDGSVVRLGQFTVFTFKEGTRDIDLKQGSALMSVPKGMGRTNIKAAAVTAAITGTTVLFQAFEGFAAIYVYEGTVEGPNGEVLGPGDVLIFENGKYRVEKFDVSQGVKSAGLFTKFTASPNAGLFSLEQLLRLIADQNGGDVPDDFDYEKFIDAILNREIEIEDNKEDDSFDPYTLL